MAMNIKTVVLASCGWLAVWPGCVSAGVPGSDRSNHWHAAAAVEDDRWFGGGDDDKDIRPYDGIPRSARLMERFNGKRKFRAPSVGTVWVGDEGRERQVISIKVKRGDTVEVDPDKDRVKKNDEVVYDRNLERRNTHNIFFKPDRDADWDSDSTSSYDGIPHSAKRVKSGTGVVRFKAAKTGRVWIGDDERERQIVAREVVKDDVIEVDPEKNRVTLNGASIYDRNLERRNEHSIFFREEKGGSGGSGGSGGGGGSKPPKDPKPEDVKPGKPDKDSGQTAGAGHPSQLKGASRVARGKGTLSFTAKEHGEFWVYNPAEKKIVAVGALKKGETLSVDPANNTTTCPSGARSFENYIPGADHEIFFKKT